MKLSGVGRILQYTPAPGFVGADSFTYTVRDNKGAISAEATVFIDVINSTPVLYDYTVATTENKPILVAVLASYDDPYSLLDQASLMISDAPIRGTVAIVQRASGPVLLYTPALAADSRLVVSDPRDLDDGD